MYQPIVSFFGLLGLLALVLLGGELSTDLDFSLRRSHAARDQHQDHIQAGAVAARHQLDPRCGRP
ncbi:MAG TPA: hypothetical protein PLW65_09480 [Pseudomonadota bacterium]|nr:hypothetical protein [Pseudomonadota bacterium]